MDKVVHYRMADANRKRRLRRYTAVTTPEDLTAELGAARLMAADAIEAGQTALANSILLTVGRLAQSQVALKRTNREYIPRSELRHFVERWCEIITKALEGRVSGWETLVDEIADALTATSEEPPKVEEARE